MHATAYGSDFYFYTFRLIFNGRHFVASHQFAIVLTTFVYHCELLVCIIFELSPFIWNGDERASTIRLMLKLITTIDINGVH